PRPKQRRRPSPRSGYSKSLRTEGRAGEHAGGPSIVPWGADLAPRRAEDVHVQRVVPVATRLGGAFPQYPTPPPPTPEPKRAALFGCTESCASPDGGFADQNPSFEGSGPLYVPGGLRSGNRGNPSSGIGSHGAA